METDNPSCCLYRFHKRQLSYEGGRVNSVDNGIFKQTIAPRHVETVVLLRRKKIDDHYHELRNIV